MWEEEDLHWAVTFVMMSVTPTVLAGILLSKHRHSGETTIPGRRLAGGMRGGSGAAGRERGK